MKKIIALMLVMVGVSYGQDVYNPMNFSYKNIPRQIQCIDTGTIAPIFNRAYNDTTKDTTEVLNAYSFKTHFVTLQSQDSATILISYRLSEDGVKWSAFSTKDSLATSVDAGGLKSVDMTSTILGANYVQFIFAGSKNATIKEGKTSAKYCAYYLGKLY